MSTRITELPFKHSIIRVGIVYKKYIQIFAKNKIYVINKPKSLSDCFEGEVYKVWKEKYGKEKKYTKLEAKKIKTTMPELLPLKKPKKVTLLRRGNGLVKIEIDNTEHIMLNNEMRAIADLEEGESTMIMGVKNGDKTVILKYFEDFQ